MSLRNTIAVVTRLAETNVIGRYAIAGAVAALYYIAPTLTEDLDILVSVESFGKGQSGLLLVAPIESALAEMGYSARSDVGCVVEGWPVQFLPVASALDEEALERAIAVDVAGAGETPLFARTLRAEHVVAIALKTGRPKDFIRIQAFLDQRAVELSQLKSVLARHKLLDRWQAFCLRSAIADPLAE